MVEHEFYTYPDSLSVEVFYKVSRGAGAVATSGRTGLPERDDTPLSEPEDFLGAEIKFDEYDRRRNALLRYFPELTDATDDELAKIFSGVPALVRAGLDRMPPNMKVSKQQRVTYSWLGGSTYSQIAQAEGFSDASKAHTSIDSFLSALRKNFTLEEIVTGELSDAGPEDPDKVLIEELEKLLGLYKAGEPSELEPEQARMIAEAIETILSPKSRSRLQQTLLGRSTRQIAIGEGTQTKVIYQWRENLMEKLGRNTTPEELIKAAQSDDPKQELAKAMASKKEDAKAAARRGAILRTFPEWEDMPYEELKNIFLEKIPDLIDRGADRFGPRANPERQLQLMRSWLSGDSSYEIAQKEDISPNYISMAVANFLRTIRREFSMEEITSGQIDPKRIPAKKPSAERPKKAATRKRGRRPTPKPAPRPKPKDKPKIKEQEPKPNKTPKPPEPVGNWPSQESKDFWEKVSRENKKQRTIVGPVIEVLEELEDY